jgi:RNA polymerase sigma-70 factor (ECF subfamily)
MMRITRTTGPATVRLQVEGRITKENAMDLQSACEPSPSAGRNPVLMDLSGVRFADEAGLQVLRTAAARGTVLLGCSGFLNELLRSDAQAPGGDPTDECALVARLRAGDEEAFEALVRQHGGRMLAVARRLLGSEPEARDAVQEAFLSVLRSIRGFAGHARLGTWLHRITVNAALMRLRSRRRRPEEPIDDLLPRFDATGHRVADPEARVAEPTDELVQRAETRALVRRAIARLPESYRTVLLLRDIEELDTEEAAAALGIGANAVKTRLHRARQALRTLIERELGGGGAAEGR